MTKKLLLCSSCCCYSSSTLLKQTHRAFLLPSTLQLSSPSITPHTHPQGPNSPSARYGSTHGSLRLQLPFFNVLAFLAGDYGGGGEQGEALPGRRAAGGHGQVRAVHTGAGGGAGARLQRVPQAQLAASAAAHQGLPHPQQHRAQADQGLVPEPQVSHLPLDLLFPLWSSCCYSSCIYFLRRRAKFCAVLV